MKVSELMINDWVSYLVSGVETYGQVAEISEHTTCANKYIISIKGTVMGITPENLNPIKLTPEILLKNNFDEYHQSLDIANIYELKDKGVGRIRLRFISDIIDILYYSHRGDVRSEIVHEINVHTLQHILRELGVEKEIIL